MKQEYEVVRPRRAGDDATGYGSTVYCKGQMSKREATAFAKQMNAADPKADAFVRRYQ